MKHLELLIARYPKLSSCQEEIRSAFEVLADCYDRGGCIFTCGNGGSAADAEHMVGELLKGFLLKRPLSDEDRAELQRIGQEDGAFLADRLQYGLRAVCLMSQTAIASATAVPVMPPSTAAIFDWIVSIISAIRRPTLIIASITCRCAVR